MMGSRSSQIPQDMLQDLEAETQYVQSVSKAARRVKIDRGHTWRIRFVPAKIGPAKRWYARIAKHWMGTSPITCPVNTHPDFGGNPDAVCPACALAEEYNNGTTKEVQDIGYGFKAAAQWITYCVVFEKDGLELPMNEIIHPYEFAHYKNTWEELRTFFQGGGSKSPLSVLDYRVGNDFTVGRTGKGLRLDKMDQQSIFDENDPNFDAYIAQIEAAIPALRITIPTEEELDIYARKMEEYADRKLRQEANSTRTVSTGRQGRGAFAEDEEQELADQTNHAYEPEPAPRSASNKVALARAAAPAPRSVSSPAPRMAPAPAATAVRSAAPVARKPAPVAQQPVAEGEDTDAPVATSRALTSPRAKAPVADPEDDVPYDTGAEAQAPEELQEQPVARPASRPVAKTAVPVKPSANLVQAQVLTRKSLAPLAQSATPARSTLDEDENIPEEVVDSAPPENLADPIDAEEQEQVTQAANTPAKRPLTENIRSKISLLKR